MVAADFVSVGPAVAGVGADFGMGIGSPGVVACPLLELEVLDGRHGLREFLG